MSKKLLIPGPPKHLKHKGDEEGPHYRDEKEPICMKEKEKQMREGYKALRNVSRSIVGASKSLQKRVIPDY